MKALWLSAAGLRLREDVTLAETAAREARVRVIAAGICGTDLALVDGLYPFEGVPGHEFVGVVEEGPDALMGRRVVGEINATCGCCPECLAGLAKHCRARTALGALKPQGTLVLKSTYPQALTIDMAPLIVDELRLVGSRCGPFDAALRMLEEQRVDVASLIDARFPLTRGIEAFAYSRRPGVLKVVLEIGAGD
jgi:threonine dehydrogenase-like Zn-dependent dehydrogenase